MGFRPAPACPGAGKPQAGRYGHDNTAVPGLPIASQADYDGGMKMECGRDAAAA